MTGGKQMDGQILRERKGNELFGPGEGEEIVKVTGKLTGQAAYRRVRVE